MNKKNIKFEYKNQPEKIPIKRSLSKENQSKALKPLTGLSLTSQVQKNRLQTANKASHNIASTNNNQQKKKPDLQLFGSNITKKSISEQMHNSSTIKSAASTKNSQVSQPIHQQKIITKGLHNKDANQFVAQSGDAQSNISHDTSGSKALHQQQQEEEVKHQSMNKQNNEQEFNSMLQREYSFLNSSSTVIIFDGKGDETGAAQAQQKDFLMENLLTDVKNGKLNQMQFEELFSEDIIDIKYHQLFNPLLIALQSRFDQLMRNVDPRFAKKCVAFLLNGIEEALYREDMAEEEDNEMFTKFGNINFNKYQADDMIAQLVFRNGRKVYLLSLQKKLYFTNILLSFLQGKQFMINSKDANLFFEGFELLFRDNQIRQYIINQQIKVVKGAIQTAEQQIASKQPKNFSLLNYVLISIKYKDSPFYNEALLNSIQSVIDKSNSEVTQKKEEGSSKADISSNPLYNQIYQNLKIARKQHQPIVNQEN